MVTHYFCRDIWEDPLEQERTQTQTREQTAQNVHVYTENYEKERIYVRQIGSMRYSLASERRERLATVPRVFTPTFGKGSIIQPGDETFRTQSLHVHFVAVAPMGRNDGHGHQNEALFYVLQGNGYEMHDGKRYDWNAGDAVAVHNDCVHWHNNPDPEERAICLVMKPKPLSIFLGLTYQGKVGTLPVDDDLWEPRSEWLTARPIGDELIPKVLKPTDTNWEWTEFGKIRKLAGEGVPLRIKGTDAYLQEIPVGSHSGKRWQMADEAVHVLDGEGYDLHWDVDAEITDQFYARIAKKPTKWEWKKGDVIWVPQNTIVQRFNTSSSEPATLVAASNRIFNQLGYSRVVFFENAPEFDALANGAEKVNA
jgi:quercetin dioxygenase-like cupin family protein